MKYGAATDKFSFTFGRIRFTFTRKSAILLKNVFKEALWLKNFI